MNKQVISKFKEKTKTAWRAMYLGLSTLFIPPALGILGAVIRPLIDPISVNKNNIGIPMGFATVVVALILSVSAIVVGIKAFKTGERSWVLWVGFIPAILIGAFWIFMIIGEIAFPH